MSFIGKIKITSEPGSNPRSHVIFSCHDFIALFIYLAVLSLCCCAQPWGVGTTLLCAWASHFGGFSCSGAGF